MNQELKQAIDSAVRDVPDFPKPGIVFKDITPIFENPELCQLIIDEFVQQIRPLNIDAIVGVESRGFIFGLSLSIALGVPFIPVRKKGKLPYKTINYSYELEYGSAEIEMHVDTVKPGWRVLVHDDLLATGGTASAAAELIKMQGGEVAGFAFLINLAFLGGAEKLKPYSSNSVELIRY